MSDVSATLASDDVVGSTPRGPRLSTGTVPCIKSICQPRLRLLTSAITSDPRCVCCPNSAMWSVAGGGGGAQSSNKADGVSRQLADCPFVRLSAPSVYVAKVPWFISYENSAFVPRYSAL